MGASGERWRAEAMLWVSFAMTSDAFEDRSKTETRRAWAESHARKFRPGRLFMGRSKDPRAGGVELHIAQVEFCVRQRLGEMSEESFQREGGERYWADRDAYIDAMGGPGRALWTMRFRHLWIGEAPPASAGPHVAMCARCGSAAVAVAPDGSAALGFLCEASPTWCAENPMGTRLEIERGTLEWVAASRLGVHGDFERPQGQRGMDLLGHQHRPTPDDPLARGTHAGRPGRRAVVSLAQSGGMRMGTAHDVSRSLNA